MMQVLVQVSGLKSYGSSVHTARQSETEHEEQFFVLWPFAASISLAWAPIGFHIIGMGANRTAKSVRSQGMG